MNCMAGYCKSRGTDPLNTCFSNRSTCKLFFSLCTSWIKSCICSIRLSLTPGCPKVIDQRGSFWEYQEKRMFWESHLSQNIINNSSSRELVVSWLIPDGETLLPHRNHQWRLCWLVTRQNALSSLHYFSSPQTPLPPLMEFQLCSFSTVCIPPKPLRAMHNHKQH